MKKLKITRVFNNNFKKLKKSGIEFIDVLDEVITLVRNNKKLPTKYKDHKLKGDMREFKECHIKNDLLLVYKNNKDTIILVNIGTHSDIFK